MRKLLIMTAALTGLVAAPAAAHPGPKLLTTGDGPQTATTPGVSYEEVNGVHLFKGAPRLAGAAPAAKSETPTQARVGVVVVDRVRWRKIRHLRTQGFYSGAGPQSRRYTQGFYSGD